MSIVEVIIYIALGLIVLAVVFKWFIYDYVIKPRLKKKKEKNKTEKYEKEE